MNIQQMYHYYLLKYHRSNLFLHTHLFITLFLQNQLGRISLLLTFFRLSSEFIPQLSPFILCKIEGNISTCFGCNNKYPKSLTPMYIRHQEWREYMPQGSQIPRSRFGQYLLPLSTTLHLG